LRVLRVCAMARTLPRRLFIQEHVMKMISKVAAAAVSLLATASAFAVDAGTLTVPEPGSAALVGVAVAAVVFVTRRSKK